MAKVGGKTDNLIILTLRCNFPTLSPAGSSPSASSRFSALQSLAMHLSLTLSTATRVKTTTTAAISIVYGQQHALCLLREHPRRRKTPETPTLTWIL